MEKNLGSSIQWTKPPSVKSVMKAIKTRIRLSVLNTASELALPSGDEVKDEANTEADAGTDAPRESTSPEGAVSPVITQLGRELCERLGPEETVMTLLSMAYGDQLDSSRYGEVTEISEPPRAQIRGQAPPGKRGMGGFKRGGKYRETESSEGQTSRIYIGLGRRHGANARDVATLLCRAGGVPGRLVDAIEMKDYCAFATMPADAARRACIFSRNTPDDPPIRLASAKG